ncbi:IS2 transposase TnpB [compost metagenome]
MVEDLRFDYGVSIRRACNVVGMFTSVYHYKRRRDEQLPLRNRIKEIAASRVRYGYLRIHILLRREGWKVNHKRIYRLYREEGLSLRHKRPKRHKTAAHRQPRSDLYEANQCWSMDFVSDALYNGKRFRSLTVVDAYTRECLAIEVDQGIRGEQVVSVLERLRFLRGVPKNIRVDNGPEFISKVLDRWAYENGVTLDFSRPGKPTDNAFIESFNGSFRDECLNVNWFLSLDDARDKIEEWRDEYNHRRPHMALAGQTPAEFARLTSAKLSRSAV